MARSKIKNNKKENEQNSSNKDLNNNNNSKAVRKTIKKVSKTIITRYTKKNNNNNNNNISYESNINSNNEITIHSNVETSKKLNNQNKDKLISSETFINYDLIGDYYSNYNKENLIIDCCLICNNKNVFACIQNNNEKLFKNCFKYNNLIPCINSIWSSEGNRVTPMLLACYYKNKKFISMLINYTKTTKFNCHPYINNYKIDYINSGGVSARTFGKFVKKVNMSRGGKEGNNAFLCESYQYNNINNIKLDFINGIIRTENSYDIVPFMKQLNYENPYFNLSRLKNLKINFKDVDNETNIYKAISAGRRDIAAYIINNYMDANNYGYNKIHLDMLEMSTIEQSDKYNITFKPSVNKKSKFFLTPVHFSCINPNENFLIKLVENGGDIHFVDVNFKKAIHYAAGCEGTGPLKYLISQGCNVDEPDKNKFTPLMYSCLFDRYHNFKLLIENNADLYRKNKFNDEALTYAAKHNRLNIIKYLIESKLCNSNKTLKNNNTMLHLAAVNGYEKLLGYLVINGAKIDAKDRKKKTPLLLACKTGKIRILSLLIKLKADVDVQDSSGNSAFHYACAYGWINIVHELVKANCNINVLNSWNVSPLEIAYLKNHYKVVNYLLNLKNINLNLRFTKGNTFMHIMLKNVLTNSTEKILYKLIDNNADIEASNNDLITCFHLICKINQKVFVQMRYPNALTLKNKSLISQEEYNQRQYIIKNPEKLYYEHKDFLNKIINIYLDKKSLDINKSDNRNNPPIIWALANNNVAMVELLLNRKQLSLNTINKLNESILSYLPNILFEYKGGEICFKLINEIKSKIQKKELVTILNMYDNFGFNPLLRLSSYILFFKNFNSMILNKENLLLIFNKTKEIDNLYKLTDKDINKNNQKAVKETNQLICNVYLKLLKEYCLLGSDINSKTKYSYYNTKNEDLNDYNNNDNKKSIIEIPYLKDLYESIKNLKNYHNKFTKFSSLIIITASYPETFIIDYLVNELKADVNITDEFGHNILFYIINNFFEDYNSDKENDKKLIKILKELVSKYYCKINIPNKVNDIPSSFIIRKYIEKKSISIEIEVLEELLDIFYYNKNNKLNEDIINYNYFYNLKSSSIINAVKNNSLLLAELLINKYKINCNLIDYLERNPLHYLFINDDPRSDTNYYLLNKLLESKCNINKQDYLLRTPVFYLFFKGYTYNKIDPIAMLSSLINNKDINWNICDIYGNNLLHYASMYNSSISLSTLISSTNINIKCANFEGNTPLVYNLIFNLNSLEELINKGADIYDNIYPLNNKFYSEDNYLRCIKYSISRKDIIDSLSFNLELYNKYDEDKNNNNENTFNGLYYLYNNINYKSESKLNLKKTHKKQKYNTLTDIKQLEEIFNSLNNDNIDNNNNCLNNIEELDDDENSEQSEYSKKEKHTIKKYNNYNCLDVESSKEIINNFMHVNFENSIEYNINLKFDTSNSINIISKLNKTLFYNYKEAYNGISLIKCCYRLNNQGLIYYLISKGYNLFDTIVEAILLGNENFALMLLNKSHTNKDYLHLTNYKETILICYAKYIKNNSRMNNFLSTAISKGIDVLCSDIYSNNILHYAVMNLNYDLIEYITKLKEFDTLILMKNKRDKTPLHILFNYSNLSENNIDNCIKCYKLIKTSIKNKITLKNLLNNYYYVNHYDDKDFENIINNIKSYVCIDNNNLPEDKEMLKYTFIIKDICLYMIRNNIILPGNEDNKSAKYNGLKSYLISKTIGNSYEQIALNPNNNYIDLINTLVNDGLDITLIDNDQRNVFFDCIINNKRDLFILLNDIYNKYFSNSNIFNHKDKYSKNLLYYVLKPNNIGFYKNTSFLIDVLSADCNTKFVYKNIEDTYKLAIELNNSKYANIIKAYLLKINIDIKDISKQAFKLDNKENFDINMDGTFKEIENYEILVDRYFKDIKLELESQPIIDENRLLLDYAGKFDKDNNYVVEDNDVNINKNNTINNKQYFDVNLIKVNIGKSYYGGDFLFYKMQIIFDIDKKLYILWNRWGRIGEIGAYQRTSYINYNDIVKEFKKIFKQKTKNDWEDINNFKHVKGKFQLQKLNKVSFNYKELLDFNILNKLNDLYNSMVSDENINTKDLVLLKTIKNLSDKSMYHQLIQGSYYKTFNIYKLNQDTINNARDILKDISSTIKDINLTKNKLKSIKNNMHNEISVESSKTNVLTNDLYTLYYKCIELSSRYYELIPNSSLANTEINPINNKYNLNKEFEFLFDLDNVEKAIKLLISVQINIDKNSYFDPYSYIKSCLNINMTPLTICDTEYKIINKLIANNKLDNNMSIYSLDYKDYSKCNFFTKGYYKSENRLLLFYQTNYINVLGILTNGIKSNYKHIESSQYFYEEGINFTDYYNINNNKMYKYNRVNYSKNYVYICEVALDNCYIVDSKEKAIYIEKNLDSISKTFLIKT